MKNNIGLRIVSVLVLIAAITGIGMSMDTKCAIIVTC